MMKSYPEEFTNLVNSFTFASQEKVKKIISKENHLAVQETIEDELFSNTMKKNILEPFKPSTPRIKPMIPESPSRISSSQIDLRKMENEGEYRFGIFRTQTIEDLGDSDWRVNFVKLF
jgi:hypothetical protein